MTRECSSFPIALRGGLASPSFATQNTKGLVDSMFDRIRIVVLRFEKLERFDQFEHV
jgi:hypothetical protein